MNLTIQRLAVLRTTFFVATRRLLPTAGLAIGLVALPAAAELGDFQPSAAFIQAGAAEEANALVVGVDWDWRWQRPTDWGLLTGYWEISFGRWDSDLPNGGQSRDWVTQIGLTPVLRLTPEAWGGRWFIEGGIGANLLLPIYRSKDKRFSTVFNFGDHIGLGRRFGERGEHEIALRVEHFSNGGIRKPNPGENFAQLRYTRHF